MELQHVNAKIYIDGELPVEPARFINAFHEWIRAELFEELLIDVADYRHVPSGPGVMLIGHEADYSLDHRGGVYGLRYNRKAPLQGSNADRYRQALGSAAKACLKLENEFHAEGLTFSRTRFELFINDRALAPHTPEARETCRPELEAFLSEILSGASFEISEPADDRQLWGMTIQSSQPLDLAAL
ncbi:MAG: hypothetical protein ACYTHJ_12615 [Planctomycetota bacterium]|jgi:hypothetical protein